MDKKIEVPFDENIFHEQNMIRWNLTNEKAKKNLKMTLVICGIVFTIGIIQKISGNSFVNGDGTLFIGLIIFLFPLLTAILLIRGKRRYTKTLLKVAEDLKTKNSKFLYEFTDKYFHYVDSQREIKLDWETFKSYSIKDKNILLNQTDDSFDTSFIIGESELTKDNFRDLTTFLQTRLKLKYV
jgi:hypothetical protein